MIFTCIERWLPIQKHIETLFVSRLSIQSAQSREVVAHDIFLYREVFANGIYSTCRDSLCLETLYLKYSLCLINTITKHLSMSNKYHYQPLDTEPLQRIRYGKLCVCHELCILYTWKVFFFPLSTILRGKSLQKVRYGKF